MTSFGLIGRCLTYLMANYTQAIGENRISFILTFLEEFGVAVASVLILTYFFGGVGIWFAILISESVPVLVYLFFVLRFRRNNKEEIDSLFMLQDSHLLVFTYDRDYEWNQADFHNIERIFAQNAEIFLAAMNDLCENIFEHSPDVSQIDCTLRFVNGEAVVLFIDDGDLYNPFSSEELINSPNIKKLKSIGCELDYTNVLGLNKSYFHFKE